MSHVTDCRVNSVSNAAVRGDSYTEGCLGQTGECLALLQTTDVCCVSFSTDIVQICNIEVIHLLCASVFNIKQRTT